MADDLLVYDLESQDDPNVNQPKVIFAGDIYDGQALIAVEEDDISIVANRDSGITVSEEFGTTIAGQVRFASLPQEMSFGGGYWRLDPRHLTTIPSTTSTPVPVLVKSSPDLLSGSGDISDQVDYLESNSDIGV